MSDFAAISAQVVDICNDRQHKGFIKITVHVPEEGSDLVSKAFGIPSYTRPVPVALARLNMENPAPPPVSDQVEERKPLSLASRAALLCKDPMFRLFVESRIGKPCDPVQWLREQCQVSSRSEIMPGTPAGVSFEDMYNRFTFWRDGPVVE